MTNERMNPMDLADRESVAAKTALALKCGLCSAMPGEDCRNYLTDKPLVGRIIHHYRLPADWVWV